MDIYAAPIQEYTDVAFRNAHARVIGGIAEYYTPFIRVEHGGQLSRQGELDCTPSMSRVANTVPQILVKNAEETLFLLDKLWSRGYRRVDFNFGCPFPKVVKSGYGAGMLSSPDAVRGVLLAAVGHSAGWRFSVKMRLGVASGEDWRKILPVLNDIPLVRVVLHPRTAAQQYEGMADKAAFQAFRDASAHPVCYNGDVVKPADCAGLDAVMVGRGLLANPLLSRQMRFDPVDDGLLDVFHAAYVEECRRVYQQPLQKLKVFWNLFLPTVDKRLRKAVQKARTMDEYQSLTAQLPSMQAVE